MISLVNLCSCAGLEGLIKPGTWRPAGQYPSICMKVLVKAEIRLKSTFITVFSFLHKCERLLMPSPGQLFSDHQSPRKKSDLCAKCLKRIHADSCEVLMYDVLILRC